jgi:tetratricopeptide (TPR) repeat protein
MTEIQTIKAIAKVAFEEKNYQKAFQTLWEAGVLDFVRFGDSQSGKSGNWFTASDSADFFWKCFVLQRDVFKELFGSDFSEQMLHNYFFKTVVISHDFEAKLAKEFPLIFVKAVRLSQVYLKLERIDYLCSLQIPDELRLHQKVWRKIYEIDQFIWQAIENELLELSKESLSDIISHCIIWIETIRFNAPTKDSIHHLASVYSFFIELILSKFPSKSVEKIDSEAFFYQRFLPLATTLHKEHRNIDALTTAKILNRISEWINFKECVVSPYSFDLDIQPKQENELLLFNLSPESRYNWLLNGARYEVNQLNYFIRGAVFVQYLEENNMTKIPGKTEKDIESNRKLAALKWSTILLLNDMGITSFVIGESDVAIDILLSPLLTYSYNRISRYELSLAHHSITSKNWLEAFIKQCMESMITGIRREPFLLMSKDEFKELNKSAIQNLSEKSAEQVTQLVSYAIKSEFGFNRFNVRYDVFKKPLLKIGDNLFCPMIFFASNIWFYSFAQEALTRFKTTKTERSETKVMETHLGEEIKQKGWAVKLLDDKEAGKMQGDVDIFVEDSDTLLYIQLKRTYFRINLKDTYYESVNTDKKAAYQLTQAELFFNKENPVFSSKKKPVKWIVSTSFENIGNCIDNCKKVNYFELLNAVKNPQIKSLNELIADVESDKNLKKMAFSVFDSELSEETRLIISETGVPLRMFETKEYRQSIFSDDEVKTEDYNALFNQAIELDKNGQKNDALILFEKCAAVNSNDAEVLGGLANTLADLKLYESAFPLFAKALELAPNDPYITRNYSIALMETGKLYDGLVIALKAFEKFPLLADTWMLFQGHFQKCMKMGLLSDEQIVELQTKWNSLN